MFSDPSNNYNDTVVLSKKELNFGFGFKDELTPDIGEIQFSFSTYDRGNRSKTFLKTKECDRSQGFAKWNNEYSHMRCFDFDGSIPDTFIIQGNFFTELFSFLKLEFVPCFDTAYSDSCLSREAI